MNRMVGLILVAAFAVGFTAGIFAAEMDMQRHCEAFKNTYDTVYFVEGFECSVDE